MPGDKSARIFHTEGPLDERFAKIAPWDTIPRTTLMPESIGTEVS